MDAQIIQYKQQLSAVEESLKNATEAERADLLDLKEKLTEVLSLLQGSQTDSSKNDDSSSGDIDDEFLRFQMYSVGEDIKKTKKEIIRFQQSLNRNADRGVLSIILTSGTLSPLGSMIDELGIYFPVQFENPHIIKDTQVFAGVVPFGSDGTPLNFSYQNRSSATYVNSLGPTICNFGRVVPNGLLVFFPSYSVMKSHQESWVDNGIWRTLSGIKPLFLEPQGKDAFQESIDNFYSAIQDPSSKGATLMAVCRGKGQELNSNDRYLLQASRAVNQAIDRVIHHKNDVLLLCDKRLHAAIKVWNYDRSIKIMLAANSLKCLKIRATQKFHCDASSISIVLEADGTKLENEEVFTSLIRNHCFPSIKLMILDENQLWKPAVHSRYCNRKSNKMRQVLSLIGVLLVIFAELLG